MIHREASDCKRDGACSELPRACKRLQIGQTAHISKGHRVGNIGYSRDDSGLHGKVQGSVADIRAPGSRPHGRALHAQLLFGFA